MRGVGRISKADNLHYKSKPILNIEQTINGKRKKKNRKKNKEQKYSRKQNH